MRNLKISLCHYPTSVLFIDDDEGYLKQLCKKFKKSFPCLSFSHPSRALDYLNINQQKTFIDRCTESLSEDRDHDYFSLGINFKEIQKEMISSDRFKTIASIVADYSMPAMNGIEFFNQLKQPYFFKLLLTGHANSYTAIKAFNKQEIDNYIPKASANVIDRVFEEIKFFEKQYFINLSNILMNQVQNNIMECLEDTHVAVQFDKICKENAIVEHVLMSESGDFILSDKQGHLSRFSVMSINDIEKLAAYALNEKADYSVVDPIMNKLKIPLFNSLEESNHTHPKEWASYLYPIQKVLNSDQFFFCI